MEWKSCFYYILLYSIGRVILSSYLKNFQILTLESAYLIIDYEYFAEWQWFMDHTLNSTVLVCVENLIEGRVPVH